MASPDVFVQLGASRDGTDPYFEAARQHGLSVWLVETAQYAHCCRLMGRREADRTITIESPSDAQAVFAALSETGARIVMVLPGFEQYTESAYVVARWLGVPPANDIASRTFCPPDKVGQRAAVATSAPWIGQPRQTVLRTGQVIGVGMQLPVVVKPANSGGGWGVFLARTHAELESTLAELNQLVNYDGQHFRAVVVEEYLSGTEFSVQGICFDGKPMILTFCEKFIAQEEFTTANGLRFLGFREVGHLAVPGDCAPDDVRRLVADCLRAHGYRNGPFHLDMIRSPEGLFFIEAGFRLSGGGLTELVRQVSGIDWGQQAFAWLLARTPVSGLDGSRGLCMAHLVARSNDEIAAARELQALGHQVEIQLAQPSQVAAKLSAEEIAMLQADLCRHVARTGFIRLSSSHLSELRGLVRRVFRKSRPATVIEPLAANIARHLQATPLEVSPRREGAQK